MKSQGTITEQINNQVATICFSHPQGNSLPKSLLLGLEQSILKLGQDKSIKVIILKSEGNAFCGGASFDELSQIQTLPQATEFFMGFAKVILAIKKARQIVIARVHGKTVGGGLGLVSACDWAIATELSSLRLSELSIGIGAFTISLPLVRKIGVGKFTELSLSTEWKDSLWAYNCGLFSEIANPNQLDEALNKRTQQFCNFEEQALREQKKLFWNIYDLTEDQLLTKAKEVSALLLNENTQKIIQSLKSK